MVILIGIAAAAAGAVLAFWFTRSAAQRQRADDRTALAAELAAAKPGETPFSTALQHDVRLIGTAWTNPDEGLECHDGGRIADGRHDRQSSARVEANRTYGVARGRHD
jgi:hypothetical protein